MANDFPRKTLFTAGLPLVIFLSYLVIAIQPDLRLSIPELVGSTAIIIILLTLVPVTGKRVNVGWSAGFILFMAAALRILFLWRSPELSDDIFRYLFDGLMSLHGHNPYAAPPADVLTDDLYLQSLISRINHSHLSTIYPPAAQFVFTVGAGIGGITGMKLSLVLVDLMSCALVILILQRLELNCANAVLYAWHPLPVIEVSASGHIDAAGIFFLFLTLTFIVFTKNGRRQGDHRSPNTTLCSGSKKTWALFAGVLFAMSVLVKWAPIMFLPGILLMIPSGSGKFVAIGFLTAATAMIAFFLPEFSMSFHTLAVFTANWEFSGFIFRSLRSLTGSGQTARLIIAAGFTITAVILYGRHLKTSHLPELLRTRMVFKTFYFLSITFLLLTPTLHPWYAMYLAAFLPFIAGSAGIVFSWTVFLAYRVLLLYGMTGQWVENDFIPFLVFIGPVSAFCVSAAIRMFTDKRFRDQGA